ncbi:hypothetical protein VTO42DRAFT_2258 [Malbranchea cinnamomea]
MRLSILSGLVALLISSASASLYPRDHDTYDYFAVHLHPSVSPSQAAQFLGARHEGQIGELEDHHTFSVPKERSNEVELILRDSREFQRRRKRDGGTHLDPRNEAGSLAGILWSEKLTLRRRLQKRIPPPSPEWLEMRAPKGRTADPQAKEQLENIATTLSIKDPIFADQWHLFNTYEVGHDLNVTGVWLEGITGKGVISAIVDDGLDMYSDDLKDNYFAEGSYDFNDKGHEPRPRLSDDKHGTRCAGEIGAVRNDVCGVGVAYNSKVAGIRILSKPVSDEDEAAAINYGFQKNDIYSCSWGPVDDGQHMDAPGILIQRAMVNGVQKGRGGRGSIFVFAAGNGAMNGDNCNFDGYTNSIYSITVGAIDRHDNHPFYSESCSAQLVVTYSSGDGASIHTTDVGRDKCSTRHGGTSAAGPLVVGVVALALSVRPELTWRDVQHIMVRTAVPIHEDNGSWQQTAVGKPFSHDFGFGKVDAYAVVQLAKEWELVKPQAWLHSPWMLVHKPVPQGDMGLASSFEVTEEMLKKNNLEIVEHVTVTMNANHTRRGDLSVELRSPAGVVSYLSVPRKADVDNHGYVDWTFMSVAHWGESGVGTWTVIVKDTVVNEFEGTFVDWQLTLWGESIDPDVQGLHPLPDVHDHDHETELATMIATTTVPVATQAASPTTISTNPTDHIDRPVNSKPTPTTESASPSATTGDSASQSTAGFSDNFLPSPFPTFGVSKSTQIWIYGSFALILVFCAALGIYFLVQRRKRLRNNPRDDYEFEMVAADDETGLLGGGRGAGGAGGRGAQRRRGGELYDAFAGDSDDEEDGILSDSEHGVESDSEDGESYHDDEPSEHGLGGGDRPSANTSAG